MLIFLYSFLHIYYILVSILILYTPLTFTCLSSEKLILDQIISYFSIILVDILCATRIHTGSVSWFQLVVSDHEYISFVFNVLTTTSLSLYIKNIKIKAIKIASSDINDHELIKKIKKNHLLIINIFVLKKTNLIYQWFI